VLRTGWHKPLAAAWRGCCTASALFKTTVKHLCRGGAGTGAGGLQQADVNCTAVEGTPGFAGGQRKWL